MRPVLIGTDDPATTATSRISLTADKRTTGNSPSPAKILNGCQDNRLRLTNRDFAPHLPLYWSDRLCIEHAPEMANNPFWYDFFIKQVSFVWRTTYRIPNRSRGIHKRKNSNRNWRKNDMKIINSSAAQMREARYEIGVDARVLNL